MSMIEKVGHDRRGNPLFKRDNEGNEILVPDTNTKNSTDKSIKHQNMIKIEDDQTIDLPQIFREWKLKEGIGW